LTGSNSLPSSSCPRNQILTDLASTWRPWCLFTHSRYFISVAGFWRRRSTDREHRAPSSPIAVSVGSLASFFLSLIPQRAVCGVILLAKRRRGRRGREKTHNHLHRDLLSARYDQKRSKHVYRCGIVLVSSLLVVVVCLHLCVCICCFVGRTLAFIDAIPSSLLVPLPSREHIAFGLLAC
jgi:hypothetical protein